MLAPMRLPRVLCFACLASVVSFAVAGCGARSATIDDEHDAAARPTPIDEQCNGLDDDLDGRVDEAFRDELGRYIADEHCGACGAPCEPAEVSFTTEQWAPASTVRRPWLRVGRWTLLYRRA